jgi:hypothetical protein
MKKGQLMAQPLIYIFYLVVAALIIFFGVKVIGNLNDNGDKVQYVTFVNDIKQKIDSTYNDNLGSSASLDEITVPKFVTEVCFVSDRDLAVVKDVKLKQLINISDLTESNVFFAGVEITDGPTKYLEHLYINGTVCDVTRDRKINLILENVGSNVEVR